MSYEIIDARIEEFQQGSWIAELVSAQSFGGSFTLNDGSLWQGTTLTERFDVYRYHTRVVGGAGKLAAIIQDKFYSGNVSLQVAVGDICNEGGERIGNVAMGIFLSTYQRIQGTVAAALSQLAAQFGLIWWIDRTGLVNMAQARPTSGDATGTRVSSDVDASIVLVDPVNVVLGASYDSSDSTAAMKSIQHVRWSQTDKKFSAEVYPLPFIFRQPTATAYDRMHNARVDKDNGDGTIDVIIDARYGEQKIPFFCGVPHSKTKFDGGEQVTVGYFAGNPNAPFAMATAQDTTASKAVARKGDGAGGGTIVLTFVGSGTLGGTYTPGDGSAQQTITPGSPITIKEAITSGSSRISVGD